MTRKIKNKVTYEYTTHDVTKEHDLMVESEKIYNHNIESVYRSKKQCKCEIKYNKKQEAWQKQWIKYQIQHKKNFLDVQKSSEVFRPKKKFFIITCIAIVAIVAALLTIAAFYDAQITNALSCQYLPDYTKSKYWVEGIGFVYDFESTKSVANFIGQVYTNSIFGKIIEIIGVAPTTLVTIFSMGIVFWNCYRLKNKRTRIAVQTISIFLSFFWFWFTGFFTYFPQACIAVVGLEEYAPWGPTVNISTAMVFLFLSIVVGGITIFATYAGLKFVKFNTMCELLRWAMIVSSAALASIIVMEVLLKQVLCRERWRFIYIFEQLEAKYGYNNIFHFKDIELSASSVNIRYGGFRPWYALPLAGSIEGSSLPFQGGNSPFMSEDITKSFPSGHQTMAACGFLSLLILPRTTRACNTRKWKITIWTIVPICLVVFALGRLVSAAHYLSDVTFGTIIAGGCLFIFYLANTYSSRWLDKACGLQIYPVRKFQ